MRRGNPFNPCSLVGALLLALLVACGPVYERPAVMTALGAGDPQVARGEQVFFAKCDGCHPHGGEGLGRGVTDRPLPDFAVRFQVRNGVGEMPGFSDEEISESDLDALMAYIGELRRFWAREGE
jgi:mono/diheme cytochrome c family protein